MSYTDEYEIVQNPFNLPTYQRRLRHLQSITVRNLAHPETQNIDLLKFQVYFTLHKDEKSKAFYTSEKITGSLNPTWQSFDLQRCDSDADLTAKFVVVRVWTGLSADFKVRLESHVHLSGLVYFADRLQVSGLKHSPDTLLFGMYNHIFCHIEPTTASIQLKQLIPDMCVPGGKKTATVYVDRFSCRPSYSTSSLSRIHTVLRAIKQTHAAVQRIHNTIEDKLVSSSEHSRKLSQREELIISVRQLRQELLRQTQRKQKEQDELEKIKTKIEGRREQIKVDDETLKGLETKAAEEKSMHIQSREMLVKENAQVLYRRKQIIHEIVHYIYRVSTDEKSNHFICNVKLPNAEDYQGHDETMVAVALGLTCHLTLMISKFMNLPLRYPMVNKGSKSIIIDHIHSKLSDKEREFPLYGKGKERFQYHYAVFLLNKNISQLRFYCGLGTSDLRETLPNIKTLLDQRLGIRSNSPSQKMGGTSPAPSPAPTSFEGSQTSRPSMAPSNSTSSFAPHFTASSDLDARDSRVSSLRQGTSHLSGMEQFDLSSLDHRGAGADFKVGYMLHEHLHDLLKPDSSQDGNSTSTGHSPEKDIENSSEQEKEHQGMNGGVKSKEEKEKNKVEEEKDDLFSSTEDNFFKVKTIKSASQLLVEATADSSADASKDLASLDDPNTDIIPDSALHWSKAPHQSFKLVKTTAQSEDISETVKTDEVASSASTSQFSPSSPVEVPSSNGRHHMADDSNNHTSDSYENDALYS